MPREIILGDKLLDWVLAALKLKNDYLKVKSKLFQSKSSETIIK